MTRNVLPNARQHNALPRVRVRLTENFGVTPAKQDELLARIKRLEIDERLIEENFIKGGGPGGQKMNKTANCVQLYYPPLDIRVRCQKERKRSLNRFLALRELVDRVELRVSPETSDRLKGIEALRKNKARRRQRSKLKYS